MINNALLKWAGKNNAMIYFSHFKVFQKLLTVISVFSVASHCNLCIPIRLFILWRNVCRNGNLSKTFIHIMSVTLITNSRVFPKFSSFLVLLNSKMIISSHLTFPFSSENKIKKWKMKGKIEQKYFLIEVKEY